MKIGYARVSTQEQSLDRQLDSLTKYGCDKIYSDKKSGRNTDRPEFKKMMANIQAGDIVVVHELSRLGRSTKDLLETAERIHEIGADLLCLKENIDTSSPFGRCVFTILGSLAQFEREQIVERINEGLRVAKANGKRVGRQYSINTPEDVEILKMYVREGKKWHEIAAKFSMSRPTVYRNLRKYGLMEMYQKKNSVD